MSRHTGLFVCIGGRSLCAIRTVNARCSQVIMITNLVQISNHIFWRLGNGATSTKLHNRQKARGYATN